MFSIFKRNPNPTAPTQNPTQVIENIGGVLDAILDMCTQNMHLLTHEERSSFMDEYRSLSNACDGLSQAIPLEYSKLTEGLARCEALKRRIQKTCQKHQEDNVRRGGQVPPATLPTTEARRSSIPNTAQSSEYSISNHSNAITTSGNTSWYTPSMGTGAPAYTYNTPGAQQTTSDTSTIRSMEDSPHEPLNKDTDCMIFGQDSSAGSPTLNIDSDGATGATHLFPSGGRPPRPPRAQQLPTARVHQQQVAQRERVMYFGHGSEVDSPTMNIRSQNATGALEQVVS